MAPRWYAACAIAPSATPRVEWPGPRRSDAWTALKPRMVAKMPVPGDASVKYVHGPGGPSKASMSIRVSRLTVTAAGVPVTVSVVP